MKKALLISLLLLTVFSSSTHATDTLPPLVSADKLKQIENLMAPIRQKIITIMQKSNLTMYNSMQSDFQKLSSLQKDTSAYRKLLGQIKTKYLDFVSTSYKSANVNESDFLSKIKSIIGTTAGSYRLGSFLSIIGTYNPGAGSPPPSTICKEYPCPTFEVSGSSSGGAILNAGGANHGDCTLGAFRFATIAGGGESVGKLGKRITVPAQTSAVDVDLNESYSLAGNAFAVIGGAYAESNVAIHVSGMGITEVYARITSWAVAPVIWYADYNNTEENTILPCTFYPSPIGSDYTIQAYAKSFLWSALISGSTVDSYVFDIKKMKVCFRNN